MQKAWIALLLGLGGWFLYLGVGEGFSYYFSKNVGYAAVFILVTSYFFLCQFFLSRGNPDAFLKDWPIMLSLDAILLLSIIFMAISESLEETLTQGSVILLSCCGGTLAGAFVASMAARRKARRR